jgi:hypothetical protein
MRAELGKIQSASYGFGGYQDVQFGLSVNLGGKGWGVSDFWGGWADEPSEYAKWTRSDQLEWHGKTADRVAKLLKSAKVRTVSDLKDVPVEVTFDGMQLVSWRVLEEVI